MSRRLSRLARNLKPGDVLVLIDAEVTESVRSALVEVVSVKDADPDTITGRPRVHIHARHVWGDAIPWLSTRPILSYADERWDARRQF